MKSTAKSEGNVLDVSVLMAVYAGSPAPYLAASLDSMIAQTARPAQTVIVQDGPLTPAHMSVLSSARARCPGFELIRLEHSHGLGPALSAGLERATGTWVARMDADDIAMPSRIACQSRLASTGFYDVIGSYMLEFERSPERPRGIRSVPLDHIAISKQMRRRNPINHPSVMFRADLARSVGGYRPLSGAEDYDLWARMLMAGAHFRNIDEPLVAFRSDTAMYSRRRSRRVLMAELTLQRNFVRYGLISKPRAIWNLSCRTCFRLLPAPIMRIAHQCILRTPL